LLVVVVAEVVVSEAIMVVVVVAPVDTELILGRAAAMLHQNLHCRCFLQPTIQYQLARAARVPWQLLMEL
jgi:hypothetical protein